MIEFLNLKKINQPYLKELKTKADKIIESGWYILGKEVELFEKNFASYVNTDYCAGVGNGFDAIYLILQAYKNLGLLKDKDEVLLASNSYIATVMAVSKANLTPKFVEPDKYYNINVTKVKASIAKNTKAVLATSLYGQSANYTELKKSGLLIIDDAAQAHGSLHHEQKNGSLADATAFSFYPTKNLGALGDGGAVTTNNKELDLMIRKLRNYGSIEKNLHEIKGSNSRLDELQAGFLNIKLKHLDKIVNKRRKIAKYYTDNIKNKHLMLPDTEKFNSPAWHLFVIRTKKRAQLQDYLLKNHIQTQIHYPKSIFGQKAYSELKSKDFPIAKNLANEVLSIPLNEALSKEETAYIVKVLNRFTDID